MQKLPCSRGTARALALAVALVVAGSAAHAGDTDAGKAKAQTCAVCHGPLGISTTPDAPNLAGQPVIYLATQLRAYRSGARKHEVMNVMAKPLTDEDITHLAAWFAAVRVEATAPP